MEFVSKSHHQVRIFVYLFWGVIYYETIQVSKYFLAIFVKRY